MYKVEYDAIGAHNLLRWFLSFRQAVADTQQGEHGRVVDESDWTQGSPRLGSMFWKPRTTNITGPGITFPGTKRDTTDHDGGVSKSNQPLDATTAHKHGADVELTTIGRRFRVSVDTDRNTSTNSGSSRNPGTGSYHADLAPSIASEEQHATKSPTGDPHTQQDIKSRP